MRLEVASIFKPLYKKKARYKGLKGGRGSGKSWAMADYLILQLLTNPNKNLVCLRQVQKSIKHSSKKLLEDRIRHYGLSKYFLIQNTEIKMTKGKGIIIFQGLQDHTADSIKSLEGFDYAWVEEAQNITEWSLDLLIPTIRKTGSELLFTWNPRYRSDAVETLFREKSNNAVLIHANYTDNPFVPDTIIQEAEEMRIANPEKYNHIYLGGYLESSEASIIPKRWIMACIDAHLKLNIDYKGTKKIGYDVADSGEDKNAIIATYGNLATLCDVWQAGKDEIVDSAERVEGWAKALKTDLVVYDSIGVGAGIGSIFKKHRVPFKYLGFNAGGTVQYPRQIYKGNKTNQEHFANVKAQAWFTVADRMMQTYNRVVKGIDCPDDVIISISSKMDNLEDLIEELSAPQELADKRGRVMVEPKDKLKERGIPSPNIADAFIMAFFDMQIPTFKML